MNPLASRKSFIPCSLASYLCLAKFADNYAALAQNNSMIEEQTGIADLPRSFPRCALFLTTNHYPLTTVSPAHNGPMMFEPTIDDQTRTAPTAAPSVPWSPSPSVSWSLSFRSLAPSLPAFLTTNHYPLTTVSPAHNGPMMFESTIDDQTRTASPSIPVPWPLHLRPLGSCFFCSLIPCSPDSYVPKPALSEVEGSVLLCSLLLCSLLLCSLLLCSLIPCCLVPCLSIPCSLVHLVPWSLGPCLYPTPPVFLPHPSPSLTPPPTFSVLQSLSPEVPAFTPPPINSDPTPHAVL
jgi:hypothetical protein